MTLQNKALKCKDLHGYLQSLSPNVLDRLYNRPATCLAVFRELPELAKHYVMRMLFLEQAVPQAVVGSWVSPPHANGQPWSIKPPKEVDPKARDVTFLDSYAMERWESVLHYMVGSKQLEGISAEAVEILRYAGLMKKDETDNSVVITKDGFQFLLMDTAAQVWYFLLQYLDTTSDRGLDLSECLAFLFELSFSTLGQDYSTDGLSESLLTFLQHLREFGLVYQRKRKAGRFYPTRLAIDIASGPRKTSQNISTLAGSINAGYIIVETNYRIYAYTDSNLQVALLGLFSELMYRFPNLVVGVITRDTRSRRVPQETPVLPPTVADQIKLWELERDRFTFSEGVLYNQFLSQADFEVLKNYAKELDVLVWHNPNKRTMVVTKEGHEDVKKFWKRHKEMANMEGPLSKWTNMMQGWQYRWFVLDDNAGLLSYYTSREKMTRGVRRGCIRLKGAVVGIDDEDDTTFTVTVDGKVFHLQSKDPEERERWIRALEDTILRHAQLQRKLDPSRPAPTMHDFDQKLAESDAYLQILIDQIKNLELRIENTSDETSKAKLCNIKDHANATLECIKHSIVLLQIAKNTTQPFNGVQIASAVSLKPLSAAGEAARLLRLPEGHKVSADVDSVITVMDSLPVQTGIEVASECLESRTLPLDQNDRAPERSVSSSGFPSRGSLANSIPVTSYSSSEDEDFFDAYEHMGQSPIVPNSHLTFEQSAEYLEPMSLSVEGEKTSGAAAVDYDELYEMDDENDFGSMESHGSVISHLLSQVKIGMDLTKVVLPTFILERRSLLEMYADFFAHPDIFTSITDFSEPRDRMVQVVRWYLSAFHAGRKSEVAKKPYNPILGETFRCWWDVEKSQTKNNEKVSDGPIPWCSREQLTFVAEQVSHHPPGK
nr:EOG090X04KD [Eulimnadia texana]